MPVSMPLSMPRCRDDQGTGVLSASIGLTFFLALMYMATQILLGLHRISTVTAEGYSSARRVAAASASATAAGGELDRLRTRYPNLSADFAGSTSELIVLRLRLDNPDLLVAGLNELLGLRLFERTISVRREQEVAR